MMPFILRVDIKLQLVQVLESSERRVNPMSYFGATGQRRVSQPLHVGMAGQSVAESTPFFYRRTNAATKMA